MLVGSHDRGVGHGTIGVDIDAQRLEDAPPYPRKRPATKAIVDGLAGAEARMQVAPRRTCLREPYDGIDEVTIASLGGTS